MHRARGGGREGGIGGVLDPFPWRGRGGIRYQLLLWVKFKTMEGLIEIYIFLKSLEQRKITALC